MFMKYGRKKRGELSSKSYDHALFVCLIIGSVLNIDPLPQGSFTTMRWQILIFMVKTK